jgi:hypothetical protein
LNKENSSKNGRQILKQYLQEIGCTDNIIDVRTARLRSLLGLKQNFNNNATTPGVLDISTTNNENYSQQQNRNNSQQLQLNDPINNILNIKQQLFNNKSFTNSNAEQESNISSTTTAEQTAKQRFFNTNTETTTTSGNINGIIRMNGGSGLHLNTNSHDDLSKSSQIPSSYDSTSTQKVSNSKKTENKGITLTL